MSFKELSDFGNRLIVEPVGISLNAQEKDILSELKPLSFIFRARNFDFKAPYDEWLPKFANLLKQIKDCVESDALLLSIDHEGGRVVRPPKPISRFPYAAKWGEKVSEVATAMAIELRSIGINVSWAPVLDVLTNKASKAIGQRAFSDDPKTVSEKAFRMAKALEENGVVPAAKHFPGYGPVTEDAHYDLPIASISRDEWEQIHLAPYKDFISKGIKLIMTAHILCPALDPTDQATLSKPILVDLLRNQMGFQGVVVADAMGMGAIRGQIETAGIIEKALFAELDLFCMAGDSVDLSTAKVLAGHMLEAVKSERVPEEILIRSRNRIESLISNLPQHQPQMLTAKQIKDHSELARDLDPNQDWANFQYIPAGF